MPVKINMSHHSKRCAPSLIEYAVVNVLARRKRCNKSCWWYSRLHDGHGVLLVARDTSRHRRRSSTVSLHLPGNNPLRLFSELHRRSVTESDWSEYKLYCSATVFLIVLILVSEWVCVRPPSYRDIYSVLNCDRIGLSNMISLFIVISDRSRSR